MLTRARSLRLPWRVGAPLALALAALLGAPPSARAQTMSQRYQRQASYTLELEPHFVAGAADPPGPGVGQGGGVGFRGAVMLSRDGFIDKVNDSVALGFGVDVLHYRGDGVYIATCVRRVPGPAGTSVCTEVDSLDGPRNYAFIPVVMQWNFWLTSQWSVFAEPGLNIFFARHGGGAAPSLAVGGRFHITDTIALTLRLGWPTSSFGVSFFF